MELVLTKEFTLLQFKVKNERDVWKALILGVIQVIITRTAKEVVMILPNYVLDNLVSTTTLNSVFTARVLIHCTA